MTNEVTPADTLRVWWENADFKGKEFCSLNEHGELMLQANAQHAERSLGTLTPDNSSALINALLDKFPEVEGRVAELQTEWDAADDRLKLLGKVSRLKEYLLHANAIGNFALLLEKVKDWEKSLDELVEENYRQKKAVLEQIETVASESENWKETTQQLKDLEQQWKQIGFVDKHRNEELWSRLEQAKNKFYERKRQHQEDSEKEMMHNLDLKLEIVEKAEALAQSEDWKQTTEVFKQLMDEWKAAGHTWNDKNEELWSRFILSKNGFFERKNAHFEAIKAEQEQNYTLKLALLERAEALKDSRDWTKTTNAYAALMEEWKAIGRVPLEKADEIWNRLNAAKEVFFNNKRQHTQNLRVALEDNYAQKLALAKRAEEVKNSNQWREATEEMNELFTEWKKIGPVPREYGDELWEQFIAARKYFFNRKDADRERRKQHFEKKLKQKEERARSFLHELEHELSEEREKLADFNEALQNVTPGNKEKELRAHLTKLIKGCEQRIAHKESLIADLHKNENKEAGPAASPDEENA